MNFVPQPREFASLVITPAFCNKQTFHTDCRENNGDFNYSFHFTEPLRHLDKSHWTCEIPSGLMLIVSDGIYNVWRNNLNRLVSI